MNFSQLLHKTKLTHPGIYRRHLRLFSGIVLNGWILNNLTELWASGGLHRNNIQFSKYLLQNSFLHLFTGEHFAASCPFMSQLQSRERRAGSGQIPWICSGHWFISRSAQPFWGHTWPWAIDVLQTLLISSFCPWQKPDSVQRWMLALSDHQQRLMSNWVLETRNSNS